MQIVQNHAVLSFWGRAARLLVADVDELLVPAVPGTTLSAMLAPGGCLAAPELRPECLMFRRRNLHAAAAGAAAAEEPGWWAAGGGGGGGGTGGTHPLRRYRYLGPLKPRASPKSLLDPSRVAHVTPHKASICTGTATVANGSSTQPLRSACASRLPCSWVPPACAFIAHVPNLLVARRPAVDTTAMQPPGWLWMLPPDPGSGPDTG